VLDGAAIGRALAVAAPSTALTSQSINFPSAPPASPAPGGTYRVTATGGASGNPVTFTIDPPNAPICSIAGSTVTFNQPGGCVIDANQAGNANYQPAPPAPQPTPFNNPPNQPHPTT